MEPCNAPQDASATTGRPQCRETEQTIGRSRYEQMKLDVARIKELLAKFTQQLEEWPAQT